MSSRVKFSQVKSRQSGFVELCPVALRQVPAVELSFVMLSSVLLSHVKAVGLRLV